MPAGDVIDPEKTIPRATLIGTVVSALIYLFGTAVVMGVIPRETLMHSAAPFADAARVMWGGWAATVIALAAVISSLGALNGWTLMLAQVPMAAARDGAMPAVFGQLSPRGVPARGLLISVGLSTMLLLLATSGASALVAFYDVIVNLSTDAAMIPYVFCCGVEAILYATRQKVSRALRVGPFTPVAIVAFVFSMGTIYGAGATAGMWSLILVLLATPVWVFLRRARAGAGRDARPAGAGVNPRRRGDDPCKSRSNAISVSWSSVRSPLRSPRSSKRNSGSARPPSAPSRPARRSTAGRTCVRS